jgi:hypothetical protein
VSYTFGEFDSCGPQLLDFCSRFDYFQFVRPAADAFAISVTSTVLQRGRLLLTEGATSEISNLFAVQLDNSHSDQICVMLIPMTHRSLIDRNSITTLASIPLESLPPVNLALLRKFVHPTKPVADPRILEAVTNNVITAKVQLRLFESAFSPLPPSHVFIHSVYATTLASPSGFTALERYIKQSDADLSGTRKLWSSLCDFCLIRHMHHNLFHISFIIRNYLEDAAVAALELFDHEETTEHRLTHLTHAHACLFQSLEY